MSQQRKLRLALLPAGIACYGTDFQNIAVSNNMKPTTASMAWTIISGIGSGCNFQ